jgi:glycosyltransferase involved in cell wall biosynthesis
MKICLIGGIYEKGGARLAVVNYTTETILEPALRAAGNEVTTLSHYDDVDFSRFDVVHVHHLSYGAARLASDPSGTPFVFTAHDASHMNGVSLGTLRRLAMRYVLSRADAIVSLCRAEAGFQSAAYPVAGALRVTIPNGIDPALFTPVPRSAAEPGNTRPWKLLFVGQLIQLKGVDLLLQALAGLTGRRFELSLAYHTNRLENELKEMAATLGISGSVKFLGKQDARQLAELYRCSDLLILPSSTEVLPTVITEAMLSGLPFLATPVGGIPEQAGGFGYLLPQRTVQDLADGLTHVFDHYAGYVRKCEAMTAYARSTFSVDAMVDQHLRLYERLTANWKTRRSGKSVVDRLVSAGVRMRGQKGHPLRPRTSPGIPSHELK